MVERVYDDEERELEGITGEAESEFGKGLTYCLGMFLAHADNAWRLRDKESKIGATWPWLWFSAASDHLYELTLPESWKEGSLVTRLKEFQSKCLTWGHGLREEQEATEADVLWSIKEAKELLRLIDEQVLKIATIEATWS